MFTAMKALPRHNRPIIAGRLLCLTVMVILLAHPVLAAVSATLACNGRCCCCASTGEPATVAIRSIDAARVDCCRPTGTAPCRMSAGSQPDSVPALVHTPDRQASDPGQLLSGSSHAAASLLLFLSPASRVTSLPALSDPPVYLRTCRLIC